MSWGNGNAITSYCSRTEGRSLANPALHLQRRVNYYLIVLMPANKVAEKFSTHCRAVHRCVPDLFSTNFVPVWETACLRVTFGDLLQSAFLPGWPFTARYKKGVAELVTCYPNRSSKSPSSAQASGSPNGGRTISVKWLAVHLSVALAWRTNYDAPLSCCAESVFELASACTSPLFFTE